VTHDTPPTTTRGFRLYWAGQAASAFGTVFTTIAIPLIAVRHLGATPAQAGVLAAAGGVPLLLAGPLVGAWADRLPRRRPYMIGCDLAAAAALTLMALALATGRATVWTLAGFTALLALAGLIVETLYFVHLRSLVADDGIVKARARLQAGEYAGGVIGRALSGPAAALSAVVPFLVDAVSYLVSGLLLAAIREPEHLRERTRSGRPGGRELAAGFALMRREPFLRRMTPFVAGQQVVAGMILAALAPFLVTVLGIPTAWYGLLFVLVGVSGLAGTALAARLADRTDAAALTVIGYVGIAATTVLLPLAGGALPLAAAIAALGIGLPYLFGALANVGLTGYVTAALPDDVLGRLTISLQLTAAGAQVAGSLLGGLLAQAIGIRPTLALAAALSGVTLLALRPMLRPGPALTGDLEPAMARGGGRAI
jgi:MFS family permease